MSQALYGPAGFYRREQPSDHFRTSAHASSLLSAAVLRVVSSATRQLDGRITVVDVGAGGGDLLAALAAAATDSWRLVGVELRPRPEGLPERVEWMAECEYGIRGALIAHELLDNIPVDVVERVDGIWRQVLVDDGGTESTGPVATDEQLGWLDRWWPEPQEADRVEIGSTRDAFWSDLVSRVDAGVAVAVDYALEPERMRHGTLTGYRHGQQVAAVPDGSCDLTAHVHFGSVAAAGEAAGLGATQLLDQRSLLAEAGLTAERPPYSLAQSDPSAYLRALGRVGELAELADPSGLGGFQWLLQTRGFNAAATG